MSDARKALQGVLNDQKAVVGELVSMAEQQGDALIARRTNALEEITARQSALMAQSASLEESALTALRDLGRTLEMEGQPTVSRVAAALGPDGVELTRLSSDIRAAADRLARLNRVNASLFESAMDSVRFTVSLLAQASQPAPVCYPAKESPRRSANILVDQRA